MIGYLFGKSYSNNKEFETKNSANIELDLMYYKKYFKYYEWSLILITCYIGLSCKYHGLSHLLVYYIFMLIPIISCTDLLNQISDYNYGVNLKVNDKLTIIKFTGVDYHVINNIPNRFVRFHLFNKFFITLLAPIIIYAVQ